jgi:hypothetical protein
MKLDRWAMEGVTMMVREEKERRRWMMDDGWW